MTRDLALRVAADVGASGGKLAKAREYGVRIMALTDFLALPDTGTPSAAAAPPPEKSAETGPAAEQLTFGF